MNRLFEQLRHAAESVRRNERRAAWLLAGAIALVCIGLLTPPIRDRVLVRAQMSVARWDARWTDRVERGENLLAERRYEEAATYLEQLDGVFPARHVKHRRDIERERVLRSLGLANLELGRKRASLDAFRRAVAFDERNYQNHFTLASAALELGEPDEALAAFDRVLAIHPSHLPTVAALIAHHFEQSDYRSVANTYEAYLGAFLLAEVTVTLGDGVGRADVLVDGYDHAIDVPLVAGDGSNPARGESLTISGGAQPFSVISVVLVPPRRSGVLDAEPDVLGAPGGWNSEVGSGGAGEDVRQIVRVPIGPAVTEVARAGVMLELFKPVDAETWAMVASSYRNLLRGDALEDARARSAMIDTPAPAADGGSP